MKIEVEYMREDGGKCEACIALIEYDYNDSINIFGGSKYYKTNKRDTWVEMESDVREFINILKFESELKREKLYKREVKEFII